MITDFDADTTANAADDNADTDADGCFTSFTSTELADIERALAMLNVANNYRVTVPVPEGKDLMTLLRRLSSVITPLFNDSSIMYPLHHSTPLQ